MILLNADSLSTSSLRQIINDNSLNLFWYKNKQHLVKQQAVMKGQLVKRLSFKTLY